MALGSGPLDRARFREVLGHFASGVTIVTGLEDGVPVGFTCQAFSSLSLEPPLITIAPARTSTSWPRIRGAGRFCVNILEAAQESLARSFAEAGADKFAGIGWSPGAVGAPRLEGSLAWIDCELEAVHEGGDHELVVARVIELVTGSGAPLVFYRGGFGGFVA